MNDWANFFTAVAGAAATLTGLIFVGVSISLARVLSIPKMPARALQAITLLLGVLFIALFCLIPHQSIFALGAELLISGVILWLITLVLDLTGFSQIESQYKKYSIINILLTHLSVLPYIVAGIMVLNFGFGGIYWVVPGIILSFVKSVIDAWVLLIEIHR